MSFADYYNKYFTTTQEPYNGNVYYNNIYDSNSNLAGVGTTVSYTCTTGKAYLFKLALLGFVDNSGISHYISSTLYFDKPNSSVYKNGFDAIVQSNGTMYFKSCLLSQGYLYFDTAEYPEMTPPWSGNNGNFYDVDVITFFDNGNNISNVGQGIYSTYTIEDAISLFYSRCKAGNQKATCVTYIKSNGLFYDLEAIFLTNESWSGYDMDSYNLAAAIFNDATYSATLSRNSSSEYIGTALIPRSTPLPDGYSITIPTQTHGTLTCSPSSEIEEGTTVTVTATPDTNYTCQNVLYLPTSGGSSTNATKVNSNTWTFTMPASNVQVTAQWAEIPTYNITTQAADNGTYTVSASSAHAGDDITVTCHPNNGFELDYVRPLNGTQVIPTRVGDDPNVVTFTMPAGDVHIQVGFKIGTVYYTDTQVYTNGEKSAAGGNVYCSPEYAFKGKQITITASPNYGYTASSASLISEATGSIIAAYTSFPATFLMPAENVLVRMFFNGTDGGDPNAGGGNSTPGGGEGDHDDTSDKVPNPSLPSVTAQGSRMVTLYRPSESQLNSLSAYLWTHLTDFAENIQKWFSSPANYLISYNIFPVIPAVGSDAKVYIGNAVTTITMPPILSQWYDFDCGNITISPYWGSALDYAPNTKIQLMLPFIGSVQLNTDEVMGTTLNLHYRIDLMTGACVAMLAVNGDIYYQWTGQCSMNVPLSSNDWSRVFQATVGAVGAVSMGVVGANSAMAGKSFGSYTSATAYRSAAEASNAWAKINETSKGVKGVAAMRQAMQDATMEAMQTARQASSVGIRRAEAVRNMRAAAAVNNVAGAVMGSKAIVSHSGTVTGSAGMLGIRQAYVIIEYPNQSLPDNYKHLLGYPSNVYARLGNLTGYTECEQVIPEGIWGTDEELAELLEILKSGFYV